LVEGKYGADSQEQVEFGEHMRVQLSLPAIGIAPHRAKALREASEKIPPP
jgi:hypothetical protein